MPHHDVSCDRRDTSPPGTRGHSRTHVCGLDEWGDAHRGLALPPCPLTGLSRRPVGRARSSRARRRVARVSDRQRPGNRMLPARRIATPAPLPLSGLLAASRSASVAMIVSVPSAVVAPACSHDPTVTPEHHGVRQLRSRPRSQMDRPFLSPAAGCRLVGVGLELSATASRLRPCSEADSSAAISAAPALRTWRTSSISM